MATLMAEHLHNVDSDGFFSNPTGGATASSTSPQRTVKSFVEVAEYGENVSTKLSLLHRPFTAQAFLDSIQVVKPSKLVLQSVEGSTGIVVYSGREEVHDHVALHNDEVLVFLGEYWLTSRILCMLSVDYNCSETMLEQKLTNAIRHAVRLSEGLSDLIGALTSRGFFTGDIDAIVARWNDKISAWDSDNVLNRDPYLGRKYGKKNLVTHINS